MEMVCQAIKPLMDMAPPDIFSDDPEELLALAGLGSRIRKMDKRTLHNAVRLLTGSAADFLDDYFESDILKGYLASSSIIGYQGRAALAGLRARAAVPLARRARRRVRGVGVPQGRQRRVHPGPRPGGAQSFGAEIILESPVEPRSSRRTAGRPASRSRTAPSTTPTIVVSALDPRRTFLELVEPARAADRPRREHRRGSASRAPRPRSTSRSTACPSTRPSADRSDQYRGFMNIGPSMDYLERAFDDAKYGWYSSRPYIDCAIQSTIDPDMAPPGKHVMSSFVQYTPYQLRESDWDTEKENLGDTVQATLESFFPGFGKLVLQREVRTPLDIERTVGLSEGNIFAGEFLAPQMFFFRPAPGWSQYRTPIDGYYQCGSGTHPGGCVIGAPGKLAAERILKDRDKARPVTSGDRGRARAMSGGSGRAGIAAR